MFRRKSESHVFIDFPFRHGHVNRMSMSLCGVLNAGILRSGGLVMLRIGMLPVRKLQTETYDVLERAG